MEKFSVHSILSLIFLSCLNRCRFRLHSRCFSIIRIFFFLLESFTLHILPLEVSIGQIAKVSSQ